MFAPFRWLAREAGLRFLARHKTAFSVAVVTMALALAANTLTFSALKSFLYASVGVPDQDGLVSIRAMRNLPGRGSVRFAEAYPNYETIRATRHNFADVALTSQTFGGWDVGGETRALRVSSVTASFFTTIRVFPAMGRAFNEAEEGSNAAHVVVVSYALWQSAMAGDARILGQKMLLNGQPYSIIGVMPDGFSQPLPTDIWIPLVATATERVAITGARHFGAYGRLARGLSLRDAASDFETFTKQTVAANADNAGFRYEGRLVRDQLLDGADSTVILVQEGAVLLLVLAVLNLTSLLLAWGFERRQELSVRLALGASAFRVIRILLLQSLFVVATGAAIGVLLTTMALPWLRGLELGDVSFFLAKASLDASVLATTAVVAVIAGVLAGTLPAWFTRTTNLGDTLRAGARSVTLSRAALRWQQSMVVVQAALSVVILAAATVIGLSFRNLERVPGGFAAHGAIAARLQLDAHQYGDSISRTNLGRAIVDNLSREPAIAAAGFSSTLPVSDTPWSTFFYITMPDGSRSKDQLLFQIRRTSPSYLSTIGIPLLVGRQFSDHDDANAPAVAIVSRALAERVWPGERAIGKRIYRVVPGSKEPSLLTVVGVAANVLDEGAGAPASQTVYIPWSQLSVTRLSIVVRPRGSDAAAVAALRHALRATDPLLAPHDIADLDALAEQANALPRLRSILMLTFAVVAIGMAMLGCYGVMQQIVGTREREYALRLVFGASPVELGRAVLRQTARLVIPGVIAGLITMILFGGSLKRFVFGVDPRSAAVLAAVSAAMLAIGVVAALPSAVRAMRVDIRRNVAS